MSWIFTRYLCADVEPYTIIIIIITKLNGLTHSKIEHFFYWILKWK